jgi:hypothetical protein
MVVVGVSITVAMRAEIVTPDSPQTLPQTTATAPLPPAMSPGPNVAPSDSHWVQDCFNGSMTACDTGAGHMSPPLLASSIRSHMVRLAADACRWRMGFTKSRFVGISSRGTDPGLTPIG